MNGHELIGAPRVERATPREASIDPLRYCVMTTVALLAWATGPWAVLVMAGIGLVAYGQATRAGLSRTRCVLKYPTLVMLYLGVAMAGAMIALTLKLQ